MNETAQNWDKIEKSKNHNYTELRGKFKTESP